MIFFRRSVLLVGFFHLLLLIPSFSGSVSAQGVTSVQEHEFADAKAAVEEAGRSKADKYAPEPLKQAQDLLGAAVNARLLGDAVKFTQASRLARAYAELAKTIAELKLEEEKLAATQEELQKARAEVDRLKKSQ